MRRRAHAGWVPSNSLLGRVQSHSIVKGLKDLFQHLADQSLFIETRWSKILVL